MSDQIKLDDCPEILKAAVKAEIANYNSYNAQPKIISLMAFKALETANTTFKVYIMVFNTFIIMDYTEPDPKRFDFGVRKNLVTIGEVKEIIQSAPEYFKY